MSVRGGRDRVPPTRDEDRHRCFSNTRDPSTPGRLEPGRGVTEVVPGSPPAPDPRVSSGDVIGNRSTITVVLHSRRPDAVPPQGGGGQPFDGEGETTLEKTRVGGDEGR